MRELTIPLEAGGPAFEEADRTPGRGPQEEREEAGDSPTGRGGGGWSVPTWLSAACLPTLEGDGGEAEEVVDQVGGAARTR